MAKVKCPHCDTWGDVRGLVDHVKKTHYDIYDVDEPIDVKRLLDSWKTIGILDIRGELRIDLM